MDIRYIPHSDIQESLLETYRRELEERFDGAVALFKEKYKVNSTQSIDSKGNKRDNHTIYTGFTGNLVLYWKLAQLNSAYAVDLNEAVGTTVRYLRGMRDPMDPPAFYTGATGPMAVCAVVMREEEGVRRVLEYEGKLTHERGQVDLLYGVPGYMYSLLFVLKHWSDCPLRSSLISSLTHSASILLELAPTLQFSFPRRTGAEYIGAAHGSLGAVQVLLLAQPYLTQDFSLIITNTLDRILSLQSATGGIPCTYTESDTYLVHFCHGATGAIAPLCQAYRLYGDERYREAAVKAGNDVWTRGLLLKGNGVCHGTAGSVYALLTLYRSLGEEVWRKRALALAYWSLLDPEVLMKVAAYDDPMRLSTGKPDTPYSLMEGQAGALCMWQDVLSPSTSALPGYEL